MIAITLAEWLPGLLLLSAVQLLLWWMNTTPHTPIHDPDDD